MFCKFNKSKFVGFFHPEINKITEDMIELTHDEYVAHMDKMAMGLVIKYIAGEIVFHEPKVDKMAEADDYVRFELENSDLQISFHADLDPRALSTLDKWREYRRNLRDYIIAGIIASERPKKPQ